MARRRSALLGASLLAACAQPEPLRLDELENAERRFAPPAQAALPAAHSAVVKEELGLEDALAIAEAMNPELAAARKNIDLATAALWESRLYPNPSLLLEVEDYRPKDGWTLSQAKRTAGVGMPIVLGGRIGAASAVAEKDRERAALEYLWRRREILGNVKRAFFALLAARRKVTLSTQARDVARSLHEATSERFRAETIPEMEVLKTAVSLARAEADARNADKEAASALAALLAAIGNSDLPTQRVVGELPARLTLPNLESLRGLITASHPLLAAAVKKREAGEAELELARAARIPDLQLELKGGSSADDETIVEGGLAVALPVFNRNQARIAAAEARIRQATLEMEATKNDLFLRLTETYNRMAASHELVATYQQDILPKAEKALEQSNEGYRLGKFGLLDVLDAQRTITDARSAHLSALADLSLAMVDLERLIGMQLERPTDQPTERRPQ